MKFFCEQYTVSEDMFKRKAELSIKRKQGRKETQGGGFYTEEAMRTELKYSANRGYKFKTMNSDSVILYHSTTMVYIINVVKEFILALPSYMYSSPDLGSESKRL